jgi:mono/diheme cytochrome c family protein
MMKSVKLKVVTSALALAAVLSFPLSATADDAALYKSKCAMCHGADGAKIAAHDLSSAAVQKQSDADLEAVITSGKPPKMPAYKSLKPEEVKGLVTYVRTLKK